MKKKYFMGYLMILAFIPTARAQNHPAFPTIDQAVARVKSSFLFKAGSPLTTEYGVSDLSKVTVKKNLYDSDNKSVPVFFSAYSSADAAELWPLRTPEDMCHVYLLLVTPKDASGMYYEIPVDVVYSRLKNDVLTNTWENHWIKPESPYIRGAKPVSNADREQLLYDFLNNATHEGNGYFNIGGTSDNFYADDLANIITIDSIVPDVSRDYNKSLTEYGWEYNVKGTRVIYDGNDKPAKTQKVSVHVRADLVKQGAKWTITKINTSMAHQGAEKKYTGANPGTYATSGIDAVWRKTTARKANPYAEYVTKEMEEKLTGIVRNLSYDEAKDVAALREFFNPEQQPGEKAKAFLQPFYDAHAKACELKTDQIQIRSEESSYEIKPGDKVNLTCRSAVDRANFNWGGHEQKKKDYKQAGMSGAVMKQTGGQFQGGFTGVYAMTLINGNWYIDAGEVTYNAYPIPW